MRPIFRAYSASVSPSRTFPSLRYILNNSNVPPLTYTGTLPFAPTSGSTNGYVCAPNETCVTGERLPSISRTMNFRVTARDNNVSGGGVADALSTLTVAGTAGHFKVTTQKRIILLQPCKEADTPAPAPYSSLFRLSYWRLHTNKRPRCPYLRDEL